MNDAGAALPISIGSQRNSHIPDQGDRPDKAAMIFLDIPFRSLANILAVGAYNSDPDGVNLREPPIFINWKPMDQQPT